jgi:hypothetical protein
MRTPVARQMLDKMLGGDELDEADLRVLMAVEREGQHVDFKDGAETRDRKKARDTVRQYVSGFANADGGLLVIGVSDGTRDAQGALVKPREITPTVQPGAASLADWARNALDDMRGRLVPVPRFQVLSAKGCNVLIVATARAPALVPCVESREIAYYLRVGDSTVLVPPYLMSDLLLGRRAHPVLEVRKSSTGGSVNGETGQGSWQVAFWFEIENVGFVPADSVRVGVVAWAMSPRRSGSVLASDNLRRFIQVGVSRPPESSGQVLVHAKSDVDPKIPPFAAHTVSLSELALPQENGAPMRSALYVIVAGHPPDWYQLDWLVPQYGQDIDMRLTRLFGEPPVVAWKEEWRSVVPPT